MKQRSSALWGAVGALVVLGTSACNAGDVAVGNEQQLVCRVSDNYVSMDLQDGPNDLDPVWTFGKDALMNYSGPIPWAMRWNRVISISARDAEGSAETILVALAYNTDRTSEIELAIGPIPTSCLPPLRRHLERYAPGVHISGSIRFSQRLGGGF